MEQHRSTASTADRFGSSLWIRYLRSKAFRLLQVFRMLKIVKFTSFSSHFSSQPQYRNQWWRESTLLGRRADFGDFI
jgi:hypothetical protein